MKVLITGGSGFIGTNLIEALIQRQHEIMNLDIAEPCDQSQKDYWCSVDLMDAKALNKAFDHFQPDWVIHLAARADCDEKTTVEEGYSANTVGHQNLLDAVKSTNSVNRLIVTSSQYVSGPQHTPTTDNDYAPVTVYGQSKVITEQLTRTADLQCCWTIIRPTNIWGPWHSRYQKEFWEIAAKNLYFHPGGAPVRRCYGYVGNLVFHIERILEVEREKVDRQVFYMSDLADDIYIWANAFCVSLGGKPARKIPRFILRSLGMIGDIISCITKKPFYITSSRVKSMTSDYLVPGWIEKTFEVLGTPPHRLQDAVQHTVSWLRENKTDQQGSHLHIVVAGQTPPPIGGQNIMIQKTLEILGRESDLTTTHLPLNFNTSFKNIRVFSVRKVYELIKAIIRLLGIRINKPIDLIICPFGGKHTLPMLRDIILIPLFYFTSKKVVVWFHTGGISDVVATLPKLFRKIYLSIFKLVDSAIVMTEFNKCDPVSLGIKKIFLVPHELQDRTTNHNLKTNDQQIRILYLGHIYPDKGVQELLQAFDLLANENSLIHLDLVGETIAPWDDQILTHMIQNMRHHDRVVFHGLATGTTKDDFYRNASLLVFPTIAPGESFGLVLAEALMWGLPIVATDWRGARDVLTADFFGELVDCHPFNKDKLAISIDQLLRRQNEWELGKERNRKIFLEYYREGSNPHLLLDTVHQIMA